jgi:hypothetical protein
MVGDIIADSRATSPGIRNLLGECLEYLGQILLNGSDEQKQGDVRLTNEAHATMIDLIHSVAMPGGETAKLRRV